MRRKPISPNMTEDYFLTISNPAEGLYREKGSKFLAFIYPVTSEQEVKQILDKLKKEYHDARHHCYAYILGKEMENFRANDAGEPPHTAGDPILNQLKSASLTNVLLVVVRYFGGTKLGKSGLIAAYKQAAADAVKNAEIVEGLETLDFTIRFPYDSTSQIMNILSQLDAQIKDQKYEMDCLIRFSVAKSKDEEVTNLLDEFLT